MAGKSKAVMITLAIDAEKNWRVNQKETRRMARRRFQNGWILKKGRNFVLRYREDVRLPDGTMTRVQRSVTLGPLAGKREAMKEATERLREINSGTRQPQSAMTFVEFWHRHFNPEVASKRKVSTQQMYRHLGTKHLLPYFGKHRLCDLEEWDVQDFINLKQRQNYSTQTLRHFRNMLSNSSERRCERNSSPRI
jgi:hypothetical protein